MNQNTHKDVIGAVLVIGGGIGGVQASLDLADSGFKVYLLDKKPVIGGVMAQLDKTFPTNDCSMCILSPKLVSAGEHLNIDIITNAELEKVDGEVGNFSVTIRKKARYVDPDKCTGCGLCAKYCPVDAVDAYNENFQRRSAVYIDYAQAVPLVYTIDRDKCIGCGLCNNVCLAEAIRYDDTDEIQKLQVGAIIASPGFDEFDPTIESEYGYGRYPNVITSILFERLLSASGPYLGHILRPSDGQVPHKIAWIQCVGSRNIHIGRSYCSSVCCMYATKEAVIASEHIAGIEPTIFYMDIRSYGKEFDKYIERAKDEYGVRYIRSRVSNIEEIEKNHNLVITYESEDGELYREEFELVVLSVGLEPPKSGKELAEKLGIELNEHGFVKTNPLSPLETTRPGIFVGGAFQSPKDIPETVAQASGVAACASSLLSSKRGTLIKKKEYPPEINVINERPRVGVFVCHCGINIGGVVNVPSVVEYAKNLPYVVHAEENLYTCSQDTQEKIRLAVKEYGLNRVVVASCTPRTHEPLFQNTIRDAGLNKYLFEMANIRDQDSWVHMHEPDKATEKAKDLVRMAVSKAALLEPLESPKLGIIHKGLVIGGGITGMVSALRLAEEGYEVYLVERSTELGGNARDIYATLEGQDVQEYLSNLIKKISTNTMIHLYTNTEIDSISGFVGNFKTILKVNGESVEIDHGIVIVATGAQEMKPHEYLYGEDPRIITQREFERFLANSSDKTLYPKTVAIIQCVGSRSNEHPYCSRICCSEAIKNALWIKQKSPQTQVYILYRDIRTYGFKEDYYNKAREVGIIFIRYDEDKKPVVKKEGGTIQVEVEDKILHEPLQIEPDLLVLSVGIVPPEDNETLSQMLKIPLNEDGFFLEAHMKLRPVDFATDGVFLAGLAHSPKFIDEAIAQANGAVSRACTILSKDELEVTGTVAKVNERNCVGCGLCVDVCPYSAIELKVKRILGIEKEVAEVNPSLCKGCGACAASCRSGSINLMGFSNEEILEQIRAFV